MFGSLFAAKGIQPKIRASIAPRATLRACNIYKTEMCGWGFPGLLACVGVRIVIYVVKS